MLLVAILFIIISSITLTFGTFSLFSSPANKKSRTRAAARPASESVADTTDQVLRRYAQRAANK